MDALTQMRSFVRIVDGGSLSAAARAERRSLAAISRQLAALEAELGTVLVVRTTRRLQLTDAGRRWYEHCARILRAVDDARDDVRGDAGVRGRLVVSAPVSLTTALLLPKIAQLAGRHPDLTIELRLEDHPVDLVGEAVDVAIRGGLAPPDSAGLVAHRIATVRRIVVASPTYLRRRGRPRAPADLVGHAALVQLGGAGPLARWTLEQADAAVTVDVRGPIAATAPLALRELAIRHAGVALLADWLVADDLAAGRLVRVLDGWTGAPASVWALHRVELRGAPRIRAFLDAIRASDGEVASPRPGRARVSSRS